MDCHVPATCFIAFAVAAKGCAPRNEVVQRFPNSLLEVMCDQLMRGGSGMTGYFGKQDEFGNLCNNRGYVARRNIRLML